MGQKKMNKEYSGLRLKILLFKAKIYTKIFKVRVLFYKLMVRFSNFMIVHIERFIDIHKSIAFIDDFNRRKIK